MLDCFLDAVKSASRDIFTRTTCIIHEKRSSLEGTTDIYRAAISTNTSMPGVYSTVLLSSHESTDHRLIRYCKMTDAIADQDVEPMSICFEDMQVLLLL